MNIVEEQVTVEYPQTPSQGMAELRQIESAARTCYKSEHKIDDEVLCQAFVRGLIKRDHLATIEFGIAVVRIVCDRGVSHEIVRHRLASFCQESTRYCNYTKGKFDHGITVIAPPFAKTGSFERWKMAMEQDQEHYEWFITNGENPQLARSVLPTSLKTEIVISANFREWRHFLKLRTAPAAHPQMRKVAKMVGFSLSLMVPVIFEEWRS